MTLNGSQQPVGTGSPPVSGPAIKTGSLIRSPLEKHVLKTLVYADIFDYPLAAEEVFRYLAVSASPGDVGRVLQEGAANGMLVSSNGYFALYGREALIPLREHREQVARQKWTVARRYVHWLALMPFVRMIAVTGTLAMNNVEEQDDIDVFVVTEPGRLWLARAFVIGVVRAARLAGDEVCPNYFLSQRALVFPERSYFAAREVAQMVPLYGTGVYGCVREVNGWVMAYLPHAAHEPQLGGGKQGTAEPYVQVGGVGRIIKRTAEWLLRGRVGSALEEWEMDRKVRQLSQEAEIRGGSVQFTIDCCKGHFDHHDNWITRRYAENLSRLGLESDLRASGVTGSSVEAPTAAPELAAADVEEVGNG